MNKITIKDIRDLKPCYDPSRYLPEDWAGTVEDILLIEECPANDRIWVALRLVPRFIAECFAIDCAFAAHAYASSVAIAAAYVTAAAADAADDTDAADAYDAYVSSVYADASAAHASAADAANVAASYAYAAAYAYASSSSAFAKKQERENQIDALLMLLGGYDD